VTLPLVEAILDDEGVVIVTDGEEVVAPSVVVVTGEVDGLAPLANPLKELPEP
jgi:hypothetical protein